MPTEADITNVPLTIDHDFRFRIANEDEPAVPDELREEFSRDGFTVVPNVLDPDTVRELNARLEDILRGEYDLGAKPDKTPRLLKGTLKSKGGTVGPLGFSGNLQNVKVLQVINVQKCDSLFRRIATDPALGRVVAELAGWTEHGVRLGQDQVWAKPPGAAPLVFHRDSPYFMFDPPDVATVWIALDDMDEEVGPLEYVKGSHHWGDGRYGSANQFFELRGKTLLLSAAEREGVGHLEIVSMAGLQAGGISIHNGRTWHGSSKNESRKKPRRGLGLHFVPAEVRFTEDARKSRLWRPYVEHVDDATTVDLPDEDFPVTWQPGKN